MYVLCFFVSKQFTLRNLFSQENPNLEMLAIGLKFSITIYKICLGKNVFISIIFVFSHLNVCFIVYTIHVIPTYSVLYKMKNIYIYII